MDHQTPLQSQSQDQTQDPSVLSTPVPVPGQPAAETVANATGLKLWQVGLVAVLGLALIAGGAMFILNRKPVTSVPNTPVVADDQVIKSKSAPTWQTYTNAKYSYTVEYPTDWAGTESPSGNGVTFKPLNSPNTPGETDEITVTVGPKTLTEEKLSFAEYAKVAATQEIQNYNKLASIEPITLANGQVGYKTTWMVQSISNYNAPESESSPITYFEIPGSETHLLRVSSGFDADPAVYDKMIKSLVFSAAATKLSAPATSVPSPTPAPVVSEETTLMTTIKSQILADSQSDGSTLTVSVSQIIGDYAKGMASDDGGGGLWFAAKVNGSWKLVWDGNGILHCSDLKEYPNFSTTLIPECYDPATEQTVKR